MRTLVLYGRPDCGLCDEMKEVIEAVGEEIPLRLEVVDVGADADLERRYGHEIPVLLVDGEEAFRHRVTPERLRARLRRGGDREHRFRTKTWVSAPREEVFAFFAEASNLARLVPPELGLEILTPPPVVLAEGTVIDYRIRLFGLAVAWRARIAAWTPPRGFVDEQARGPYRSWVHAHRLRSRDGGTEIEDDVRYRLPLPPLGELAHPLVRRQLERLFGYREAELRRRFGGAPPGRGRGGR